MLKALLGFGSSETLHLQTQHCTPAAGPDGELPEALQKLDPHILELVCNEVVDRKTGVAWDDIAGQEAAKKLIQELVVWPMLNPDLFKVQVMCLAKRETTPLHSSGRVAIIT